MSIISASNTLSTAFTIYGDTNANLLLNTGANVTAVTIGADQTTGFTTLIKEGVTVSSANATANVNFDVLTQSILLYTSNSSANTTINFRGNSTVTMNSVLASNQSASVVFLSPQGATPKYISGYQIDGTAVTPKWQGGSAPTSGNANSTDVYSFTIIKTANATYTVLASQTQFA